MERRLWSSHRSANSQPLEGQFIPISCVCFLGESAVLLFRALETSVMVRPKRLKTEEKNARFFWMIYSFESRHFSPVARLSLFWYQQWIRNPCLKHAMTVTRWVPRKYHMAHSGTATTRHFHTTPTRATDGTICMTTSHRLQTRRINSDRYTDCSTA